MANILHMIQYGRLYASKYRVCNVCVLHSIQTAIAYIIYTPDWQDLETFQNIHNICYEIP